MRWSPNGRHGSNRDRKSTRLNSSHANISYAVFCLKKKISIKPEDYPTFLRHLFRLTNIRGALITMQHKITTVALVDDVTPTALIFFFNDTAPTEIYTLSLHDALPI